MAKNIYFYEDNKCNSNWWCFTYLVYNRVVLPLVSRMPEQESLLLWSTLDGKKVVTNCKPATIIKFSDGLSFPEKNFSKKQEMKRPPTSHMREEIAASDATR